MSYEPEQRYLKDLSARREANTSFDAQGPTGRGELWAVTNNIRSRWTRRGAAYGIVLFAAYQLLDGKMPTLLESHLFNTLAFIGALGVGGGVVGFVVASIWRKRTGEP